MQHLLQLLPKFFYHHLVMLIDREKFTESPAIRNMILMTRGQEKLSSHLLPWVTFSLRHNAQHSYVKGGKVYFGSQFVEVLLHSWLAPRQGGLAGRRQQGINRRRKNICMSFQTTPRVITSFHQASPPSMTPSCEPISGLSQWGESYFHGPVTSPEPHLWMYEVWGNV